MGYDLLINGVYWGYNPFTNHLLSSWHIQVYVFSRYPRSSRCFAKKSPPCFLLFAAGIENCSSWNVKDHFSAMLKHKSKICWYYGCSAGSDGNYPYIFGTRQLEDQGIVSKLVFNFYKLFMVLTICLGG